MIRDFKDLLVWQRAMDLAQLIYRETTALPRSEQYGLSSQLQRSAVSIPSNIAEGHARQSTRDYLRFLSIALGSAAELETQLLLAQRFGYLEQANATTLIGALHEVGRMIRGLQKRLRYLAPSP